jgi:hypothetical protein
MLALAVVLASASVNAGGGTAQLEWARAEGAESCPSAAEVRRDLATRLGRDPFTPSASMSIEVMLTRTANEQEWRASLVVRAADGRTTGTRSLASTAPDCAPLAAATTLAVALSIDPDAKLAPAAARSPLVAIPTPPAPREEAPARSTAEAPPSTPSRPPAAADTVASPKEREKNVNVSVALRGGAALGVLPNIAPALGVAAGVDLRPRFEIHAGTWWLPEQRTDDGQFGFGLTGLSAGACYHALDGRGPFRVSGCADAIAGAIHAVVYELTPSHPGDRLWVALEPGVRVQIALVKPLSVELGAAMLVPLGRYTFTVGGRDASAFESATVGGIGHVGVGASF